MSVLRDESRVQDVNLKDVEKIHIAIASVVQQV